MDIKSLIQFAEQDAKEKGINLKSPLTKEFVQFWTDNDIKGINSTKVYADILNKTKNKAVKKLPMWGKYEAKRA